MSDQSNPFRRKPVSRVDSLRAGGGNLVGLALFNLMVWAYAGVIGSLLVVTAIGLQLPERVLPVLGVGSLLPGYLLAVQTVTWWRRRQTPDR